MRTSPTITIATIPLLVALAGCNVEGKSTTQQGVNLQPDAALMDASTSTPPGGDAAASDAGAPAAPRARGFLVVQSDYSVANVSVVDSSGKLLSQTLLSSASEQPGLSSALSGDVVAPTSVSGTSEIVLIDRGHGVVSWVDLESAEVTRQLNVGPEFEPNPQDYVPFDAHTAFVPRYARNGKVDVNADDAGDDIAVVDPSSAELVGHISLAQSADEGRPVTPNRAVMAGGYLRVTAIGFDGTDYAEARLITIDPKRKVVVDTLHFPGVQNCTNLAVSPNGERLALGCTGPYTGEDSAVVIVSTDKVPEELARLSGDSLDGATVNTVEFVSDSVVAFTTFGQYDPTTFEILAEDSLRTVDLGNPDVVHVVAKSKDAAFALSDVRCIQASELCVLTDGATAGGQLRRFQIGQDGQLTEKSALGIDDGLTLPPRYLGIY